MRIDFLITSPRHPRVLVDGPADSPHRYDDGSLCMWYPRDPLERRWVFDDGLMALLGQITAHLVKEHLWRITGRWPGDEVPHADSLKAA